MNINELYNREEREQLWKIWMKKKEIKEDETNEFYCGLYLAFIAGWNAGVAFMKEQKR